MQQTVTLNQIRKVRVICKGELVAVMDLEDDKFLARPPLDNGVLEAKDVKTNKWSCYRIINRRIFPIVGSEKETIGYQIEIITEKMGDC